MTYEGTLTDAVRGLYERHPYPRYPLFARPRWQEGYLACSSFSARLASDLTGAVAPKDGATVLIAGGGEILPYVIRRLEPTSRRLISIDLSRRSINRARLRLALARGKAELRRGDVNEYLASGEPGQVFSHIDAYGVLHHLPNPTATLGLIAQRLAPGGTARLMVYNSRARDWIWHLQRFHALLGVDGLDGKDLASARNLLSRLAGMLPPLRTRMQQMGTATLANDARFADTFLHPREARLGIATWFRALETCGLKAVGLFDRYGELDDLPNPLWRCPTAAELSVRADDYRFENNLELFVVKPGLKKPVAKSVEPGFGVAERSAPGWSLPPKAWFTFRETRELGPMQRLRLWRAHRQWTLTGECEDLSPFLAKLPLATAARLARIGAVLPGQVRDGELRARLGNPLVESMEAPLLDAAVPPARAGVTDLVKAELEQRGRYSAARLGACLERLHRSQR